MVLFPNCKINLGLNIVGKRTDGYHDLETVFYPVQLRDAVEVIENENVQRLMTDPQCSVTGLDIHGDIKHNLCSKAYSLLKKDFQQLPSIKIHLHKTIPIGAGLGGGSADGACMLQLLNEKFGLGLTENELIHYALQLGSDCPFFIINKPCFATGRGEHLDRINVDLSDHKLVIVHPQIHVSTAEAFANIKPHKPVKSIKEIVQQPISSWKSQLKNDFEETVFLQYPAIKEIKEALYRSGAFYASMTGTGSAVYGIFEKSKQVNPGLPKNHFVKELLS